MVSIKKITFFWVARTWQTVSCRSKTPTQTPTTHMPTHTKVPRGPFSLPTKSENGCQGHFFFERAANATTQCAKMRGPIYDFFAMYRQEEISWINKCQTTCVFHRSPTECLTKTLIEQVYIHSKKAFCPLGGQLSVCLQRCCWNALVKDPGDGVLHAFPYQETMLFNPSATVRGVPDSRLPVVKFVATCRTQPSLPVEP